MNGAGNRSSGQTGPASRLIRQRKRTDYCQLHLSSPFYRGQGPRLAYPALDNPRRNRIIPSSRHVRDEANVSNCGLNISENLDTYTPVLSNSSFMSVLRCLFSGGVSSLDAFSSYPLQRGCSAVPCQTTDELEATNPRSSRTKGSFPSGINTLPPKSNKPVSRRSEPSSRSLLMGEQPHPW